MSEIKAKIHYLYHSGFAIETTNHFLVLDYYKNPSNKLIKNILSPDNIKLKKNMYVFSSHSHGDHFNPAIFKWQQYNPEIKYVLSSDIDIEESHCTYIRISEGDEKRIDDITIRAYGSTDIGISFLVKVDELVIFHAGDLNWWHWKEDSLEEQKLAEVSFKQHIEKIKAHEAYIDIAFFPVDPRLEESYYIGGEYFSKELQPKLFIPMHFGDETSVTRFFSEKIKELNISSAVITTNGQEIMFKS
ncbi:MBL fold metallo-hydrolase [Clostridium sp.]|uniref:MBL fold metallo-hydrolase n=1 Tax=Clostridium sp. TaxID=1506 RepID=UPI002FC7C583